MPVETLAVDAVTDTRDTAVVELARTTRDEVLGGLADATTVDLPARTAEGRFRRNPAVDAAGDLAGIVTPDDVVATAGEMLKDVATVVGTPSREDAPAASRAPRPPSRPSRPPPPLPPAP